MVSGVWCLWCGVESLWCGVWCLVFGVWCIVFDVCGVGLDVGVWCLRCGVWSVDTELPGDLGRGGAGGEDRLRWPTGVPRL